MKNDIVFNYEKGDIDLINTTVYKAQNLLLTQVGDLFYCKKWGIDLAYFFDPEISITNEAFINYVQQQITANNMNINDLQKIITQFTTDILLKVSN